METKELKRLLSNQTKDLREYVDGRLSNQTKDLREYVDGRLSNQTKVLHEDYARQGKFLLDEFKHQTSIVAEQYIDLKKDVKDVKKDVSDLKKITNITFEEVGKLRVDIEIIKEDVQIIKSGLKRKVDLEEFEALEKRVLILEKNYKH